MYITLRSKEHILNTIELYGCWSEQIDFIFHDKDFNVYVECNTKTSENFLKAELVVKRSACGTPVETSHERCHMIGNLSWYVATKSMHLIVRDIINMYKDLYNRKHKKENGMKSYSYGNKAVYYICNLAWSPTCSRCVKFLYRHPAFDKIEFVSDNDSRCTWFYSEKDVKDFIAEHRYYLSNSCENVFVVKAVRVGRTTERTFYNLDLNEERYDLYGPVESCCKRLARYSRISEDKSKDEIYISTASRGSYGDYIRRDMESTIWAQRMINNKLKELIEEMNLPKIKKVIFNNPATIVFWADESKTIVKCENEEFDPEKGLSMAISKKALGNKHDYYNVFKKWLPKEKKEDKKPTKKNETKKPSNKKNNK